RQTAIEMATVKTHWWGITVVLGQPEACVWTDPLRSDIAGVIAAAIGNFWGSLVVAVVALQKQYIRSQNEKSGCKGVNIYITWAGIFIGCDPRGSGVTPCGTCEDSGPRTPYHPSPPASPARRVVIQ